MTNLLTFQEYELVQNTEVFFTKNSIINKCYELFGQVTENFNTISKVYTAIPTQAFLHSPKISKGENYQGLPWVMLDYYRTFNVENSFAIRCFFWWGNSFSFHVYATDSLKDKILEKLSKLPKNWFGCINESAWLHEFTTNNYLSINKAMETYKTGSKSFIKVGCYIPINAWNKAESFYTKAFKEVMELL